MARPIYRMLLLAALIFYVVGVCLIQVDMYRKIGRVEHTVCHMTGKTVDELHGSHSK